MSEFTFRFAVPEDAEMFAKWAAANPEISEGDIRASMKENNPTSTVLVVEKDGVPAFYVPLYCVVRIAYLGFNPDLPAEDRGPAMEIMLNAIKAFAANFGINEVNTLTKSHIPVARWARQHGFKADDRELYSLTVNEPQTRN